MWHDHPFSQRNRTTERSVGLQVGGDREMGGGEGVGQNLEKGGGVGNIGGGGSSKNRGFSTPLSTMQRDFKDFPAPPLLPSGRAMLMCMCNIKKNRSALTST